MHQLAAGLAGLPLGKAPGHQPQQVCQQRGPGVIGYRAAATAASWLCLANPS